MTTEASEDGYHASLDFNVWRSAADTLPIIIFTAKPDGTIEFVNRRWTEFSGYESSAEANADWQSRVHSDDTDRVAAVWRESIAAGVDFSAEMRIRKADGTYAWILVNVAPFRERGQTLVRWYGTVVDIDKAKRTAQELTEREVMLADSERRFRVLGEAIPVICWTADASGYIDWYNHRWYEYTGQSAEEAAGWGWQAAHHPEDFLEVMRAWPDSIATGKPFEMEFRLRRHDGVFHWFLTRVEPLRDASGRIVRWYGSNVDIDAQKQALERTKRIAETLQDIFLPKQLPQRSNLRLDAVYSPAEKDALVGGDWFDAFELPDKRLVFSIGDVAGHGLQASIIVGRLRQAIFTLANREGDPAVVLEQTDRILQQQEPDTLVTALVAFLDPSQSELRYAGAGHPAPLIADSNAEPARVGAASGPPLGSGLSAAFTTHRLSVPADCVVALYTDGMIEFSHDILGNEQRLRTAIALMVKNTTVRHPARAVQELVLDDQPTKDDAALLLLQFSSVPMPLQQTDSTALTRMWRFHSSDAFTAHKSRHEIIEYLRSLSADSDELFNSELVIGEILANTVEHAPGLVELYIDWNGEKPLVTVRDTGPGLRRLKGTLPEDAFDEDGRGIFLIKALTEHVTVRPSPGFGTDMRVILPLRRAGFGGGSAKGPA